MDFEYDTLVGTFMIEGKRNDESFSYPGGTHEAYSYSAKIKLEGKDITGLVAESFYLKVCELVQERYENGEDVDI